MNKIGLLKKTKKSFVLCLVLIVMSFNLIACGSEPSAFKQDFESSSYKKLSIYKGYNTNYQNLKNFEKGHGYMSIESKDNGKTILFKGFYQIKSVHIGTQDLTQAFKTNTVEEFAKICGYEEYQSLVDNELFKCTSNELFNYNGYVVYLEPLKTGGSDLYLGKKFEYNFENDKDATAVYNKIIELLAQDDYDKFDYSDLKDEYGNLKKSKNFAYALVLGLNEKDGGSTIQNDVLVGETKYTYNFYSEMEKFLFSLDKELSNVDEQSKNNNNTQTPVF